MIYEKFGDYLKEVKTLDYNVELKGGEYYIKRFSYEK